MHCVYVGVDKGRWRVARCTGGDSLGMEVVSDWVEGRVGFGITDVVGVHGDAGILWKSRGRVGTFLFFSLVG